MLYICVCFLSALNFINTCCLFFGHCRSHLPNASTRNLFKLHMKYYVILCNISKQNNFCLLNYFLEPSLVPFANGLVENCENWKLCRYILILMSFQIWHSSMEHKRRFWRILVISFGDHWLPLYGKQNKKQNSECSIFLDSVVRI